MTGLVVWTVIDILLLIAGLAFYLFWVGSLLTRIAGNLEECAEIVQTIVGHAKLIGPGVERGHRDRSDAPARAARGARAGPARIGHAPLAPARRGRLPVRVLT